MNRCFRYASAILPALVFLISGCNGDSSANLTELSHERQCWANMNTLSTDQANYRDAYGEWADCNELLDEYARRTQSLVCPGCGECYTVELTEDGYIIECPSGHGSVVTGRRSWTGNDPG